MANFRARSCQSCPPLTCAILGLLACLLTIGTGLPVRGQISFPNPATQSIEQLPVGVQRLGAIEVASVRLEGRELFEIASPTAWDRLNSNRQITPVEVRTEYIEANLNRIISFNRDPTLEVIALYLPQKSHQQQNIYTKYDPETLQVFVSQLRGATVILATDARHSLPLQLLTVTEWDASYHGQTIEKLAQQWRSQIFQVLSQKLQERLPRAIQQQINEATANVLAAIVASCLLWVVQRWLKARDKVLVARQADEIAESSVDVVSSSASNSQRHEFFDSLRTQLSIEQRRSFVAFLQLLLRWGQVVVWLGGIASVFFSFPPTKQLAWQVLGTPIQLLLIWFLIGLANWIGDELIRRLSNVWKNEQFFRFESSMVEDVQRKSLRIATTVSAIKGLKSFAVWLLGVAWTFQSLGVPIGSVLAGGAVVAFALSFGFQNLVKDLVNGCLILWEDQYGIGDVVAIGNTAGLVEHMNLRITQIRDNEGRLISVPNSSIARVENLTRTWSRVDFTIEIAYDTDIEQALAVVRDVAQQIYTEPEWRKLILELPEVLGVDRISHAGMLIRVWLKTQPLQQWSVEREFRLRIRVALAENSIGIGTPQHIIWYR